MPAVDRAVLRLGTYELVHRARPAAGAWSSTRRSSWPSGSPPTTRPGSSTACCPRSPPRSGPWRLEPRDPVGSAPAPDGRRRCAGRRDAGRWRPATRGGADARGDAGRPRGGVADIRRRGRRDGCRADGRTARPAASRALDRAAGGRAGEPRGAGRSTWWSAPADDDESCSARSACATSTAVRRRGRDRLVDPAAAPRTGPGHRGGRRAVGRGPRARRWACDQVWARIAPGNAASPRVAAGRLPALGEAGGSATWARSGRCDDRCWARRRRC